MSQTSAASQEIRAQEPLVASKESLAHGCATASNTINPEPSIPGNRRRVSFADTNSLEILCPPLFGNLTFELMQNLWWQSRELTTMRRTTRRAICSGDETIEEDRLGLEKFLPQRTNAKHRAVWLTVSASKYPERFPSKNSIQNSMQHDEFVRYVSCKCSLGARNSAQAMAQKLFSDLQGNTKQDTTVPRSCKRIYEASSTDDAADAQRNVRARLDHQIVCPVSVAVAQ